MVYSTPVISSGLLMVNLTAFLSERAVNSNPRSDGAMVGTTSCETCGCVSCFCGWSFLEKRKKYEPVAKTKRRIIPIGMMSFFFISSTIVPIWMILSTPWDKKLSSEEVMKLKLEEKNQLADYAAGFLMK